MATALNSVVRISVVIDGTAFQGSGVMISPDEVLTANHVSQMASADGTTYYNGVATHVVVDPGYDKGLSPLGSYTGIVAHHFNQVNMPGLAQADIQSDYSIIHLDKPIVGGSVMKVVAGFAGGSAHVTGYPGNANGAQIDQVENIVTDLLYTIYDGPPVVGGSSGSPVWNVGADGVDDVFGIVSAGGSGGSFDVKFTDAVVAQINSWVMLDDAIVVPPQPPHHPVPVYFEIADLSTGATLNTAGDAYTGPVAGLLHQMIIITADNLNITGLAPNSFIHTGAGTDAIDVSKAGGNNVLDGGTGSNFLVGGAGNDTFFVDDRNAPSDIWSTVSGFHSGDAATLWGVTQTGKSLAWSDGGGAAGYTGLTLHATAAGAPTASLTLAGWSMADLANGKLTTSYGAGPSGDYLYLHAT